MNKLYYGEEGDLIGEMYYDKDIIQYIRYMRTIYYTIDTLDFQSIVYDSLWTTVQNKCSIDSKLYFINYFKRTLKNNLINKLKYDQRNKRHTEEVIPYTQEEEELIPSTNSSNGYDIMEILLFLEQEKVPPLCIKYAELIMKTNTTPTDTEAAKILNCDRRTVKKCKCILKDKLYTQ